MALLGDYYAKNKKTNPLAQSTTTKTGQASGGVSQPKVGLLSQYQQQNKLSTPFEVAPVKKVSTTPVKVTQTPQKQVQQQRQPTMIESTARAVQNPLGNAGNIIRTLKSVDYERVKKAFTAGAKGVPGQLKTGGGIIAESWRKQQQTMDDFFKATDKQHPIISKALSYTANQVVPGRRQYEAAKESGVDFNKRTTALKEQGFQSQQKAGAEFAKMGKAKNRVQEIADMVAFNLPQMAVSTALTVGTGILTKNPQLASTVGLSTSYGFGANEVYNTARQNGLSDKEAQPLAMYGGAVIGALDAIPLERFLRKSGAIEPVKKSIMQKIAKQIVSTSTSGILETGTEMVQEIIGNAIEKTYNENKDLFEGVKDAGLVAMLTGGAMDIAVSGVNAVGGHTKKPEQMIKEVNENIEKALNTPENKRSFEQHQLVDALLTRQMTPDEAANIVISENMGKTEEGKKIMQKVLEAKQNDQDVIIKANEDGSIDTVEVVDPNEIPSVQEQVSVPDQMKENEGSVTEGDLTYKKSTMLKTPEKQAIEAKFGKELGENYQKSKETYIEKFGNTLNTDNARELSSDYMSNKAENAVAVHEPASAFVSKMYDEMLQQSDPTGNNIVTFTGGGTGAGKTTATSSVKEAQQYLDSSQIIYDTTLQGFESADKKIQQALDKGKKVVILYVHRDAVDAFENGVIPRAVRDGRTVPYKFHIDAHVNAPETVKRLIEKHGDNENFTLEVIDNTKGKGNAAIADVAILDELSYNKDELNKQLQDVIETKYKNGEITEQIYNGLKGTDSKGDRTQDGRGSSQESQQSKGTSEKESVNNNSPPKTSQRVLNTKEVTALKEVIDDRFKEVRQLSENPKDISRRIDSLYKDITTQANNDKVVLSALRTQLNKEMFGLAGAGGNYKEAYAQLQAMIKEDPEMGPVLSNMEDKVASLDKMLLSAQEPARVKPTVEKLQGGGNQTTVSKETPTGTGKPKNSRFFERVKEALGSEYENENRKYNTLDLEKQARGVADLIENNPEKATQIALGRVEPPQGMTQNAVALGLAEVARSKGDMTTLARLWTETSLRSTRLGQELVTLRGKFSGNEGLNAVKAILNVKMQDVAKRYDAVIKGLNVPEDAPVSKKVDALVKHEAKKAKKEVQKRQAAIKSAQDILNDLMCKV